MCAQPLVHGPQQPAELLFRDVHVLDPRAGLDGPHDVRVRAGRVVELAAPGTLVNEHGEELLDARSQWLLPAFFDPHVHLRTPGQEHKEDLDSGTRAAASCSERRSGAESSTGSVLGIASTAP